MALRRLASLLWFALAAFAQPLGCGSPPPPTVGAPHSEFEDFTTPRIDTFEQFRSLTAKPPDDELGAGLLGAKFVITDFAEPNRRTLRFLDGRYYLYHDEWAWFRLLNGQPVAGMRAIEAHPVNTPEEARRQAQREGSAVPDGLEVTGDRLYSEEFYTRALEARRSLGAGSLIYVPRREASEGVPARDEAWGFELEYLDRGDVEDVRVFFEMLQRALPQQVARQLRWLTRSPWQAEVAIRLVARYPEYAGRVMSYLDLSVPGELAIYNGGIVAGRLQVFHDLSQLGEANPDNILLLGALPEYLPQARGLLTAIPQTPLAHLNLLAKNRGIVNVYRGGLLDDPEISNLARSSVPVVMSAEGGQLRLRELTEHQYAEWRSLERPTTATPHQRSANHVPYSLALTALTEAQVDELAPFIGGKAVGLAQLSNAMLHAAHASGIPNTLAFAVPERPLVITVRAYRDHLAPLLPRIRALLDDANFRESRKLRILALEGLKKFERRFPSPRDRAAARTYALPNAAGPIAALVRAGGLQHLIRHTPLPAAVRQELDVVRRHFAAYSPTQGLRFRSSSTVEDVEGSSGAGLYDSATGFVDVTDGEPRPSTGDKRPSLADALRKTWASYYSVEAFEERHEAGMDHLAGDMAVLVHARFDDALENANGVFTFTLHPTGAELLVDAQPGAVSVTNPPTDRVVRPESTRVSLGNGTTVVEELLSSSETRDGRRVLNRNELEGLFHLAHRITQRQLARVNARLAPEQQRRSLVLDFEFRRVEPGWPALKNGTHPSRFVIKQMRPLERAMPRSTDLDGAPLPRDVLARARRAELQTCGSDDGVRLEVLVAYTDPNAAPDLGYSEQPFVASVTLVRGGVGETFSHLQLTRAHFSPADWDIDLGDNVRYRNFRRRDRSIVLTPRSGSPETHLAVRCETRLLYAAPSELLRSYLQ